MKANSPILHLYSAAGKRFGRFLKMAACAGPVLGVAGGVGAADLNPPSTVALADFPLEDLVTLKITSVSKKEENLMDAAAAIFVLSNDDLRRFGTTSVPDALRLVPGLQVGALDSAHWAISSRGFNQLFANKLLVMIDGRGVYTPLFPASIGIPSRYSSMMSSGSK